MPAHTINVALTLRGPVLSGSTAPGAPGLDAACHRTDDGRWALPGSLIKGRVRDAWNELTALDPSFTPPLDTWLGRESDGPDAAGLLDFGDDWILHGGTRDASRIRIVIDPERQAADTHMMQTMEHPWAIGAPVALSGSVRFSSDQPTAAAVLAHVTGGLQWLAGLGALEGLAFGEVVNVETTLTTAEAPAAVSVPDLEQFDVVLVFDRSICFAQRQPIGNLFESADIVPGSALKAAVIRVVKEYALAASTLLEYLDAIRFEHAVPVEEDETCRPGPLPLSLVSVTRDDSATLHDVALTGPCLIHGQAPAFAVDWKRADEDAADALRHWHGPARGLRSHHRHCAVNRRAAGGDFFAHERVLVDGFRWRSSLDLSRFDVATRHAIAGELATALAHGLTKLGKTKARAKAVLDLPMRIPDQFQSKSEARDGLWIVVLNAPALLCNPQSLGPASSSADMRNAYADVWSDISKGTVTLKDYLAKQSLAGGEFLWRRFRPGTDYEPYLLTEAGSVFVLEAKAGSKPHVDEWLRDGLPLPTWAEQRYGNSWKNCPYVPQNGYGAVSVNMPIHWMHWPDDANLTVLTPLVGKE